MPNPSDIKSLEKDDDPDDELRMQLDQGQGNNLAGAPMPPGQAGMPGFGAPSGVQGPLAAIPAAAKLKPRIKLKVKPKPRIKLKTSPLQTFLNSLGG